MDEILAAATARATILLDAVRPQLTTFDALQNGERKKPREQLDKIDNAYNTAFGANPDGTELKKLVSNEAP